MWMYKLLSRSLLRVPFETNEWKCKVKRLLHVHINMNDNRGEKSLSKRDNKKSSQKPHHYRGIELIVYGAGKRATPRGILVHMDFSYLFNTGEGLQRIMKGMNQRTVNVKKVFYTDSSWKNISSLLGLCLELESTKIKKLNTYGLENSNYVTGTARPFAKIFEINVDHTDVTAGSTKDELMQVEMIPLKPEAASNKNLVDNRVVLYHCVPKEAQRKVDKEKLVALDFPKGKLVGNVVNGETVTLEDGRVIGPDDILKPPLPNKTFVVLECPDKSYIKPIVNCEKLKQYQTTHDKAEAAHTDVQGEEGSSSTVSSAENVLDIVVHLTPTKVLEDLRYKEWMKSFGEEVNHLVLNDDCPDNVIREPFSQQIWLNLIHPEIFPLLPNTDTLPSVDNLPDLGTNVTFGVPGLEYTLRGSRRSSGNFNWSKCTTQCGKSIVTEALEVDSVDQALETLRGRIEQLTAADMLSTLQYPEFVFLGTGSSVPCLQRNVSSILVHLSADSCLLMDCGEETAAQIHRFYGDHTDQVLAKINTIWISHLHADHHMGLIGVVEERRASLKRLKIKYTPVTVIGPHSYLQWLKEVNAKCFSILSDVRFVSADVVRMEKSKESKDTENEKVAEEIFAKLGIKEMKSCRVIHPALAYGVMVTCETGYKFVYSGDTTPCDTLIHMGRDCDLLIHEATFEDQLHLQAVVKKHSTVSQAVDVGNKMNSQFTILTHFSQRYHKVALLPENLSSTVGVAYDNMKVRPCDLHLLPLFIPTLQVMFADEIEEMLKVRGKREYQRIVREEEKRCAVEEILGRQMYNGIKGAMSNSDAIGEGDKKVNSDATEENDAKLDSDTIGEGDSKLKMDTSNNIVVCGDLNSIDQSCSDSVRECGSAKHSLDSESGDAERPEKKMKTTLV